MNKTYIAVIVLVLAIAVGWFFMGKSKQVEAPSESTATNTMPAGDSNVNEVEVNTNLSGSVEVSTPSVKEFVVDGNNFNYVPATMKVKKGDTVKIVFKNVQGFHDFKIDEFKVSTKQIQAGEEEAITFVADKAGSFEYYCSVGSHRAMGMVGTLIVE